MTASSFPGFGLALPVYQGSGGVITACIPLVQKLLTLVLLQTRSATSYSQDYSTEWKDLELQRSRSSNNFGATEFVQHVASHNFLPYIPSSTVCDLRVSMNLLVEHRCCSAMYMCYRVFCVVVPKKWNRRQRHHSMIQFNPYFPLRNVSKLNISLTFKIDFDFQINSQIYITIVTNI